MVASSAKHKAGIFLMDKVKFREYKWHTDSYCDM